MAPYPALSVAGNEREGIERGGVGGSRDEEGTDEERERNWSFRDYLWKIRSLPRPDSSGWMLGVCLDAGGNVIR